jgi:hypothetical protein
MASDPQTQSHGLPEAEVDGERGRGDELRKPDMRAVGFAERQVLISAPTS